MRKSLLSPIVAIFLLASCVPPPQVDLENTTHSPASVSSATGSTAQSDTIELPIEEAASSSSVITSTGALAERIVEHGILEIGPADAPGTLTIFTNFSSKYCGEFSQQMLPRLEREFVATGKLKLQIVMTPFKKYPNSALEASAVLCGAALGRGHDVFLALMETKLRDRKSILALAKKLGISAKEFPKCLDAKETKALLEEQTEFIRMNEVTLVPTLRLRSHSTGSGQAGQAHDEKLVGLPSYADLRGWIREQLGIK